MGNKAPRNVCENSRVPLITSIVRCSQCSETFLASSVPDLELDDIVLILDGLQFEIDADSIEKVFVKLVVCVTQ